MDERRVHTLLYAGAALALGVVGAGLALRPGGPAPWANDLVVLGVAFFALSAVPAVRSHDAYNAVGAAFATAVCLVAYLGSGSLLVGVLAVGSAAGTLVELYNWQSGTEYMRL